MTIIAAGDTYITQDAESWIIGSARVSLRLGADAGGPLRLLQLARPGADTGWDTGATADSSFLQLARRQSPGQSGLAFLQSRVSAFGSGVRLDLIYEDTTSHLRVTRSYAVAPGSPGVEIWSTFEADRSSPELPISDIAVWQVSVAARQVRWLSGLGPQGGAAKDRFTRHQQTVAPNRVLDIGSTGRSSESAVPAVSLDGPAGHLLAGLLWSGEWRLGVGEPGPTGLTTVRLSLGDVATIVKAGEPFETPHGFVGVADSGDSSLADAWHSLITYGVRGGRAIEPLTTFNTWFAHGIRVDEETVRADMDQAASLGIELFVLDAGWYRGGTAPSDYTTGLGVWAADPARFPSGLRALRDYAHARGMKFGIWAEPERVDTTTVNRPGLARERFLATIGGRYNPGVRNESAGAAQVCLGDTEARTWLLNQMIGFLDEVRPDYLKWDNNYWINCDRSGHGHGDKDGNLVHVKGLYGILAALRQRYPDMSIENCASGGNRLDLGMLQFTDSAWMDDVSAPSAHVRHNLEGLSAVFPPAYLLSFVVGDPSEEIHRAADPELILRSRMPGILGFSIRPEEFGADELETMRREIGLYKRTRPVLRDGVPLLLTDQADPSGNGSVDALQVVSRSSGNVSLYTFSAGQAAGDGVRLQGLDPDAVYSRGPRNGRIQSTGAELMSDGIAPAATATSDARIVLFTR